jgi:hypothetical protein
MTEAAPKQGRGGALFLKHLDHRRQRLRRYRKIHGAWQEGRCRSPTPVVSPVGVVIRRVVDRIELVEDVRVKLPIVEALVATIAGVAMVTTVIAAMIGVAVVLLSGIA